MAKKKKKELKELKKKILKLVDGKKKVKKGFAKLLKKYVSLRADLLKEKKTGTKKTKTKGVTPTKKSTKGLLQSGTQKTKVGSKTKIMSSSRQPKTKGQVKASIEQSPVTALKTKKVIPPKVDSKPSASQSTEFNAKEAIAAIMKLTTVQAVKEFTKTENRKTVLSRVSSRISALEK